MTPNDLIPASSALAGALLFAAAFLVGYVSSQSHGLRSAFYGALSLAFTIAGSAALFGNLISILGHK